MLFRTILTLLPVCSVISGAHAEERKTLLLFGDSIIAGYNLPEEEALHVRLEAALAENGCANITVINGGVSGDTTSGGRARLAWSLKKHAPDAVFLALGGNDMLRGISPDITEMNLDAMLNTLQTAATPVLFSRVNAPQNMGAGYISAIDTMFSLLSERYHTPLYPFILEPIFGDTAYMQRDGIHPNAAGVDAIAEKLTRALTDKKTYPHVAFLCSPLI